jgi:LmbE family N-acetylglucosaminyl deacetylase
MLSLRNRGLRARLAGVRQLIAGGEPLFDLPQRVAKPAGERIVVFAPHPDDETIGCGGTLHQHQLAGDSITAVFMTDGRQGTGTRGDISADEIVAVREAEARQAAQLLGIGECVFLRNPDAQLSITPATVAQVNDLLARIAPDLIYVPSPLESHRDHRLGCAIVARAVEIGGHRPNVCLYEVWSPVPANLIVPIDLGHKIKAIRVYRSQLDEHEQYVAGATHLAHYRGLTGLNSLQTPAECFLSCDHAEFISLARDWS